MKIFGLLSVLYESFYKVINRLLRQSSKYRFAECGKNVSFSPLSSDLSYSHLHIGNEVQIGSRACLVASIAHIYIANKVRFGPHVTIRGGNHRFDIVGKFIYDISDKEKRPEDDQDVIVEDDVWVGANSTILKGVTIGRGSIIAAGSVVTKSIPPYSIAGGIPAKKIKSRFSEEEIKQHEKILYGKIITFDEK